MQMDTRSRRCRIATVVLGTILISTLTLLIHVQLSPSCNHFAVRFGRLFGDDSITFAAAEVEKCDDLLCKKYLTKVEWRQYKNCVNETIHPKLKRSEGPLIEQDPTPCTFYNGTAKKGATLLVSYPGSGNTWLRGLLQQVTGVCTGSHWCDMDLRRRGFPGEGIYGKRIRIMKTFDICILFLMISKRS